MVDKKIDPMDQYRKREKLNNLKYLLLTLFIFGGMAVHYGVSTAESLEIYGRSVRGPAKYIFTFTVLVIGWFLVLAVTGLLVRIFHLVRFRKEIPPHFSIMISLTLIRRLGLALFMGFLFIYCIHSLSTHADSINFIYFRKLSLSVDGIGAMILGYVSMILLMMINMFAASIWMGMVGIFNSEDFVEES